MPGEKRKTMTKTKTNAGDATLTVPVQIKLSRLADLLCCGFEGGVNYWCQIRDYRKPRKPVAHLDGGGPVYPHVDYALCEDGAVICGDTENDDSEDLVLDLDAIKRGLALMPIKAPHQWGRFLSETEDAETGDAFIQCCLLGGLVYG